jgi:hypothetical protein
MLSRFPPLDREQMKTRLQGRGWGAGRVKAYLTENMFAENLKDKQNFPSLIGFKVAFGIKREKKNVFAKGMYTREDPLRVAGCRILFYLQSIKSDERVDAQNFSCFPI